MPDTTLVLLTAATAASGLLAGASLDQSIKQLPARHRIGVIAFSRYSQASDLGNGIAWYAGLGIGAALLTIGTAIAAFIQEISSNQALPIYVAGVLAILHSLVTVRAAPTNFSQRRYQNDEAALAVVFDRFTRWQALRAILQVLTFGTLLWAMVIYG